MKRSFLLACTFLTACSSAVVSPATTADAGDPGAATPGSQTAGATPSADDGGAGGGGGGVVATPGDDAGAPVDSDAAAPVPPQDGGAPPTPGAGGSFTGAGPYVATLGPSARNPKHAGDPNPAGLACLSCHGGQRPNVVRFLFAGTVWDSAAGTTPAAQKEVRILQANGTAHSAWSDADGNFFFPAGNETLAPPAQGGARDATNTRLMANVFNDGDCNSCHRAGGTAPVHVP